MYMIIRMKAISETMHRGYETSEGGQSPGVEKAANMGNAEM